MSLPSWTSIRAQHKPRTDRSKHKNNSHEDVCFVWFKCFNCQRNDQSRWWYIFGRMVKKKVWLLLFLTETSVQILVTTMFCSLAFAFPCETGQCYWFFYVLSTLPSKNIRYVHLQPGRCFINLLVTHSVLTLTIWRSITAGRENYDRTGKDCVSRFLTNSPIHLSSRHITSIRKKNRDSPNVRQLQRALTVHRNENT